MNWQPIYTAPRDGSPILVCARTDNHEEWPDGWWFYVVRWKKIVSRLPDGEWIEADGEQFEVFSPTFWAPVSFSR